MKRTKLRIGRTTYWMTKLMGAWAAAVAGRKTEKNAASSEKACLQKQPCRWPHYEVPETTSPPSPEHPLGGA